MITISSHMSKLKYLVLACIAMILSSCDDVIKKYMDTADLGDLEMLDSYIGAPKSDMEVTDVIFSPDYKTFTISTRMVNEGPGFSITDTTLVRTEVKEYIESIRRTAKSTPRLVQMKNVEGEEVQHYGLSMFVLVDRTLPQEQLEKVQRYMREMRTVFDPNHLHVAFMDGDKISKPYPATDYIVKTYFKHVDQSYIYLYRAMQNFREMIVNREGVWKDAKRCVMITFATERPYDDNSDAPYDTDHYTYEEKLVRRPAKDSTFLAYYINMDTQKEADENISQCVPYIFCNLNGGEYLMEYDWIMMKRKIYDTFNFNFPDNRFTFINPDYKVYRGDQKSLTLNIYDRKTDKLVASFTTTVKLGSLFKPIIVNGHNIAYVIAQGILLGLFIFIFVYFMMQVVIPLIRYLIFRHKYVFEYTGSNMSVHNHAVGETCYLCKAPFQPGDKIVAKCEHTMHEHCWEENDYHCPEYSDRCKHGSHYFNKYNFFDPQNASFYMRWVLWAIGASIVSWLGLTLYVQLEVGRYIFPAWMMTSMGQVPFLGFVLSLCLSFIIATLAINPRGLRAWGNVLLRTTLASLISYLAFLLVELFIYILKITILLPLFNSIPWIVSSFVIVICSTKYTRVVYNKRIVILSVVIGLLSMLVWNIFYTLSELDFRVVLLFSFLFYYLSMAVSVATAAPRSERYFLKVEGAVKTMDVALYKWLRDDPHRAVTIGKSVDCSLQLSWDLQSNIAPVQAEIRLYHKVPYLIPKHSGVFIKKLPLRPNLRVRLVHGRSFTIGKTTFTYIEKDR